MTPKKLINKPFKDIPGVKYPEPDDKVRTRGRLRVTDDTIPYDEQKWILSSDAAKMFECSGNAVRALLHRRKVKTVKAKVGHAASLAWDREAVQRAYTELTKNRVNGGKEGYLEVSEVCKILGIPRSTLYRYTEAGMFSKLTGKGVKGGNMPVLLYDAAQIYSVRNDLQRIRELTEEIRDIRNRLYKRK